MLLFKDVWSLVVDRDYCVIGCGIALQVDTVLMLVDVHIVNVHISKKNEQKLATPQKNRKPGP